MLSQNEIIMVMREAVYTVLMSSLPMLLAALVIGVIISIFQATTQINEQTLAFVPKIIGILLALILFGGMILNNLSDFTINLFESVSGMLT
ncbi:MAG: flagellar biosynthesis protein FliQ [Oscillospiraceae bacterium]|nr:flagellar biosynthesis protein FliQ [Oscillospiraceae bacterium]MBR5261638.1 flagellar biosynthesis protein FliQ [Oscillospiraceae bacterium]